MRHLLPPLAALALAWLGSTAAGCSDDDPAQVMVFVQAEPGVREQAEQLEVRILGGPAVGDRSLRETLVYTDAALDEGLPLSWPVRIALVPEDGDTTRTYEVVATAENAGGLVARTRVISGYLSGEVLALHVWLRDDCIGVQCADDETCRAGTCEPAGKVDPCELEDLDGDRPDGCDDVPDAGGEDAGTGDAGADAGDGPDGGGVDGGTDPTERHNVAFVTSTLQAPRDLGGLDGADALCNERAAAAGLPRPDSYVAWLSTADTDARDRLSGSRGWVRVDGRPVADTVERLTNGILYYPIALDELGSRPSTSAARVATGTKNDGRADPDSYLCDGWTETDGGSGGNVWHGNALDGPGRWSNTGNLASCDTPLAILCFGTGRTAPLDPPSATGSLAFLSRNTIAAYDTEASDGGTPMTGRDRMDQLCQSEAEAEGFEGTFLALVSTPTEAALDRLQGAAAPWVRPDGTVVAEDKLDVSTETLLAPVAVTVDGIQYGNHEVWAGAYDPGSTDDSGEWSCDGWTTDSGTAKRGFSGST
ncbi:MAG: hypothetical protein ACODAG_10440, partial [Myxococcota bacterium]